MSFPCWFCWMPFLAIIFLASVQTSVCRLRWNALCLHLPSLSSSSQLPPNWPPVILLLFSAPTWQLYQRCWESVHGVGGCLGQGTVCNLHSSIMRLGQVTALDSEQVYFSDCFYWRENVTPTPIPCLWLWFSLICWVCLVSITLQNQVLVSLPGSWYIPRFNSIFTMLFSLLFFS